MSNSLIPCFLMSKWRNRLIFWANRSFALFLQKTSNLFKKPLSKFPTLQIFTVTSKNKKIKHFRSLRPGGLSSLNFWKAKNEEKLKKMYFSLVRTKTNLPIFSIENILFVDFSWSKKAKGICKFSDWKIRF